MTKEETIAKYPFLANMTDHNIKSLLLFIMMAFVEISLRSKEDEGTEPKIAVFMTDIKALF